MVDKQFWEVVIDSRGQEMEKNLSILGKGKQFELGKKDGSQQFMSEKILVFFPKFLLAIC